MPTVYNPSPRQSATDKLKDNSTSHPPVEQMPVKKSKKVAGSSKKSPSKKSPKKKGSSKKSDKKKVTPPDPLSSAAMVNAYYISHDAVDFLSFRGYRWEGAGGSKKKKKK